MATQEEVRSKIITIIDDIAMDEDLESINDEIPLRDQFDLDSMDFLDIVMELKKRHNIVVPQEDYGQLASIKSCVEYLTPKF